MCFYYDTYSNIVEFLHLPSFCRPHSEGNMRDLVFYIEGYECLYYSLSWRCCTYAITATHYVLHWTYAARTRVLSLFAYGVLLRMPRLLYVRHTQYLQQPCDVCCAEHRQIYLRVHMDSTREKRHHNFLEAERCVSRRSTQFSQITQNASFCHANLSILH